MAFCINCGKELVEDAKFCFSCGSSVNEVSATEQEQRKTVYDGEIHKCPNCGEVLNSFVAICPACGFELREKKVSLSIKEFSDSINECNKLIASASSDKRSLGRSGTFFFVTPIKLSDEEHEKASLIKNYIFPNDRESVLSALVYIREQIDHLSKENIDPISAYWMRVWHTKAQQLKETADMLFPNDKIVEKNYIHIHNENKKVNEVIKRKRILSILSASIILIICLYFMHN